MKRRIAALFSVGLLVYAYGCDGAVRESVSSALRPNGGVQWGQSAPRFAHLNDDEVLDVFGWVNEWTGELSPRVAAYDGESGERLWISPILGAFEESYRARMGLVGGMLVVADAGGTARAFRPGAHAPAWATELGERATVLCDAGSGEVVVRTVDRRALALDLASGSARPVAPPRPCTLTEYPQVAVQDDSEDEARLAALVPDMGIRAILAVSPDLQLVVGPKRAGTEVPMVAAVQGERVVWASVVPAEDPLRAQFLASARAAADERSVFVVYEREDGDHIAAFTTADGQRLWDIPVPQTPEDSPRIGAMGLTPERLYVAHLTYLSAVDRATGEVQYTIGQRR